MILFLLLFLGFAPAFIYATILYWLDRYEKEPKALLGGVFAWGSIVATIGALIFSLILQSGIYLFTGSEYTAEVTGTTIIAPVVEESLKGFAVVLVFLIFRREFDSILDGIVYAGITALGFAATENVLYLFFQGYQTHGLGGMLALFFLRAILGGWNHVVFTAFIGIGLAVARLSRTTFVKIIAPVGGWVLAVFAHAVHNTLTIVLGGALGLVGFAVTVAVDWTGWAIMLAIIIWATSREYRWIVTHLREEVEMGVITPEQYRIAYSAWAQTATRLRALGSGRYRLTNRFYQLCAELAQKKHQYLTLGEQGDNAATIETLRAELARVAPTLASPAPRQS